MGGVYSALFGMSAVWGGLVGLSVLEISIFVAAFYVGGLVLQYPIGWLSDRMDRRQLIVGVSLLCGFLALLAGLAQLPFAVLLVVAFLIGGLANPLYSLLLAHTNDFLSVDDMAGASGGLLFINGVGSIFGPLMLGWLMDAGGPPGFFLFIGALNIIMATYGLWRMTRRRGPEIGDQGSFTPLTPSASAVTLDAVFEAAQPEHPEGEHGVKS